MSYEASLEAGQVQLLKLLHNREDHFHLYSLSAVHSHDLYYIQIVSFSSYNGYKLNSAHLTCFQRRGFITQLVEHRTGIAEIMCSKPPVEGSEFFLGFLCNCLSCFIIARITFTSILYPQFTHDLDHIHIMKLDRRV